MKKIFLVVLALLCGGFIACSDDAEKNKATAQAIFSSTFDAVTESVDKAVGLSEEGYSGSVQSITPPENPPQQEYTESIDVYYENNTIHVYGTESYNDETQTYTYNLTVALINYTSPDGILINGSATDNYIVIFNPLTYTAHLTGDFDVVYDGTNYDFSWNINFTWDGTNYTLTGGFYLNGEYYPAQFVE
jgi:hypothetical protein